jgi:hypothetical protein
MTGLKRTLAWLLVYLPHWFSMLFTLGLGATVVLVSFGIWPSAVLYGMLWAYGAIALVTYAVRLVFGYRHGAIGLQSWREYLRDQSWQLLIDVALGLFWPYTWLAELGAYAEWGLDWWGIAVEPTMCLIQTHRQGLKLETLKVETISAEQTFVSDITQETKYLR